MRRRSRHLAAVALVALLGAACGSDSDELSSEEQAYADALAADLADTDDGIGVTDDEAACMGEAIMAELGTEPFEKADVGPDDLGGDETPGQLLGDGAVTEAQAASIFDAMEDCADIAASLAAGAKDEFDVDDEAVECIEDGLRDGTILREYMIDSFTNGDEPDPAEPPLSELIKIVVDCTADSETGAGGALVDSIAASLAETGDITDEQAQCVAQSVVDAVGVEALIAGGASGDFAGASAELQQQVVKAITDAAGACGVPLSSFGG